MGSRYLATWATRRLLPFYRTIAWENRCKAVQEGSDPYKIRWVATTNKFNNRSNSSSCRTQIRDRPSATVKIRIATKYQRTRAPSRATMACRATVKTIIVWQLRVGCNNSSKWACTLALKKVTSLAIMELRPRTIKVYSLLVLSTKIRLATMHCWLTSSFQWAPSKVCSQR